MGGKDANRLALNKRGPSSHSKTFKSLIPLTFTFAFLHLVEAFIQSDLHLRNNKASAQWKFLYKVLHLFKCKQDKEMHTQIRHVRVLDIQNKIIVSNEHKAKTNFSKSSILILRYGIQVYTQCICSACIV